MNKRRNSWSGPVGDLLIGAAAGSIAGAFKRRRGASETGTRLPPLPRRAPMIGQEMIRRRSRRKLGQNRLSKHLYNLQNPVIDRFQGLTNYDVDGGYFRLSQCNHDGARYRPIHIYDLTSIRNETGGVISIPEVARHLGWTDVGTSANVIHRDLIAQSNNGDQGTGANKWFPESTDFMHDGASSSYYLNWIDARFNFYGCRKRDTKFQVRLVQFPDDDWNLWHAAPADLGKKSMLSYLERSLIYNNLQTGDPSLRKRMRVLATYTYHIPATTSIDLNTAVGKICEAKIFFRMNRVFRLNWNDQQGQDLPHGHGDGHDWDVVDLNDNKSWPQHSSRVFMIVSAFSPEDVDLTGSKNPMMTPAESWAKGPPGDTGGNAVNTTIEPSYDVLIRRKYYVDRRRVV